MRRPADAVGQGIAGVATRRVAVGFADLVDSTSLTERLTLAELGSAISDLENTAADLAAPTRAAW